MKALIMLYYFAIGKYSELVANSCMGANCVPYLQELSVKYDFAIAQDYAFIVDVNKPISAYDVDTKKLFNDAEDFMLSVCGRWGALEYDWLHFDYNEYLKLKEEFNALRST